MQDILLSRLEEGLRGDLKKNSLAKRLYALLKSGDFKTKGRRELATLLLDANIKPWDLPTSTASDRKAATDLRLLGMGFKNVKKYPAGPDGMPFGLAFSKKGHPMNSVFTGVNGIGKTSIYALLELFGMGKMNTAEIRGYNGPIGVASDETGAKVVSQKEFIQHLGSEEQDFEASMLTKSGEKVIKNLDSLGDYQGMVPDAFFCSEYDVRVLESCESMTTFLINQVGLRLYNEVLQTLYYTKIKLDSHREDFRNLFSDRDESPERDEALCLLMIGYSGCPGLYQKWADSISGNDFPEIENLVADTSQTLDLIDVESLLESVESEKAMLSIDSSLFASKAVEYYDSFLNQGLEIIEGNLTRESSWIEAAKDLMLLRNEARREIQFANLQIDAQKSNDSDVKRTNTGIVTEYIGAFSKIESKAAEFNSFGKYTARLLKNSRTYEVFEKRWTKLVDWLEAGLREFVEENSESLHGCITSLLQGYFMKDNDEIETELCFKPFSDRMSMDSGEADETDNIHDAIRFDIWIRSAKGDWSIDAGKEAITPRAYLNTFKYKLFCVALKIALGCVAKKIHHLNFPFVIDDVFDSSDFNNRLQLKGFIQDVVTQHNQIISPEENPFQLVFFTQDDLIAGQIRKGLQTVCGDSNVKFSRIFDYHECDEKDRKRFGTTGGGDGFEYISIEDVLQ